MRSFSTLVTVVGCCAAVLSPTVATAQAAAAQHVATKADTASRATKTAELEGVVVRDRGTRTSRYAPPASSTASKLEGPLRDIPQSVSVVGRAAIADQAMQGMQDVMRYVPGVGMAQGEGNRDAPVIRGNSSTADFFVDGVRDDAQYLRDTYNVERVEALKGANAMAFGRGGGGGVINRVSKEASWMPSRELTLAGGSFGHRRVMMDAGGEVAPRAALRVNGMLERSSLFRDATTLERFGVNPTAALALTDRTMLRAGFERFEDQRTADRGIPSFAGRPVETPIRTFFGDPSQSRSRSGVLSGTIGAEHHTDGGITLRARAKGASYDKFYQNVFPGAVDSTGTRVSLSGYSNNHLRNNLFGATEAGGAAQWLGVRHSLLGGAEVGLQRTDNFRKTGYFGGTATTTSVLVAQPNVSVPAEFRQSATDADNRVTAHVASAYAQDQLWLGDRVQAVVGLRLDRFSLDFANRREGGPSFSRVDRMVSPRVGLVLKPAERVSVYGNYTVSHLPSSGDQFSSLTATTSALEPEGFTNREVGVKWDAAPALAFTAAAYRLDRANTSAPDPVDPKRIAQTGRQRSTGVELGLDGDVTPTWQVQGGMALQRAEIVERTSAAPAGARTPLVPASTFSLWNRVQLTSALGAGLGVIRQGESFAAIDNTVTLPAFTRADVALFTNLGRGVRAQANVENVLGTRYYATSQGNNNIQPGAPRTLRVALVTGF